MKAIINGKLIIPNSSGDFIIKDKLVILFDKTILSIIPNENFNDNVEEIIDVHGQFVSPGFINVHIHGCVGFDTMDDDDNALTEIRRFLISTGVTGFLPTTMTLPMLQIHKSLRRIRNAMNIENGARILGANVEGPFISKEYKGAQSEENIIPADFSNIAGFSDVIKIITFAPEKLNDLSFINNCINKNIILSIGHSAANYEVAMDIIKNHGVKHITHLFNAQTGLHHRKPGIVGAALDSNAIVEIITDNVHVHPAAQRIVYKIKKRNEIILITDSLRACGLGDGNYELGGQKVIVKDNIAKLENGTIAASVATMNEVVKNFMINTGADIAEVVEFVTKNPAMELKIYDKLGSLEVGKLADIITFDNDLQIKNVIVNGNILK